MEEILKRAEELGRAIREHPRYTRLVKADAAIRADPEATKALREYQEAAQTIARKEHGGQPVEPEEKRNLEALRQQVAGHDAVKAFSRAQVDYAELMRKMDEAIFGQLQTAGGGEGEGPGAAGGGPTVQT